MRGIRQKKRAPLPWRTASGGNMTFSRTLSELRPENPQYGYTCAFYLYRAGQLDEAIKAIHTARERHPTHEDSLLLERQLLQEQEQKRAGSQGH